MGIVFNCKLRDNSGFQGDDMFEVTTDGEVFYFDNFDEIAVFFNEVVWAVGAVDAEIKVKFSNPLND